MGGPGRGDIQKGHDTGPSTKRSSLGPEELPGRMQFERSTREEQPAFVKISLCFSLMFFDLFIELRSCVGVWGWGYIARIDYGMDLACQEAVLFICGKSI